jgi:hypothetical protein
VPCKIYSSIFLSSSAVVPALTLVSINSWNMWVEHWEHWEHMPPLEERTEYPYQNLRVKNYPWGNGDKVSLSVSAVWSLGDLADLRACFFQTIL